MSNTHKTPVQIAADKRTRALRLPTNRKPPTNAVQIVIAPSRGEIYWSEKR